MISTVFQSLIIPRGSKLQDGGRGKVVGRSSEGGVVEQSHAADQLSFLWSLLLTTRGPPTRGPPAPVVFLEQPGHALEPGCSRGAP